MLIVPRQLAAQVFGTAKDEIEHLTIQRIRLAGAPSFLGLPKEPIENVPRIDFGWYGLSGRTKTAVRIVPLVEAVLVLLVRLGHRGQLQRRQRREASDKIRSDLVSRNCDFNHIPLICIGQRRGQPCRQLERMGSPIERGDWNPRNPLHHEALVQHRPQRSQGRRWRG